MLTRSAVVATALVLAGAACGGTPSSATTARHINASQVELQLSLRVKERSPNATVGKATCPADVWARTGETFQCTVEVEGQPARYSVTISEILGNQAQYDFRPQQAIVDLASVSDFVRSRLDAHWRTAQIDCGRAKVRLADVGATIVCTVFDGSATRYVEAKVEDRDGALSLTEQ